MPAKQLIITYDTDNGSVSFQSQVENRIEIHGLLALVGIMVEENFKQQQQNKIVPANIALPRFNG